VPDDLYWKTAGDLLKAIQNGLGGTTFSFDDSRNALLAHFQDNVFQFSAAKSQAELIHINSLLNDIDGNLRSFTDFRNACLDAGYQFNVNWLQTEYNTAISGSQMAFQWDRLKDMDYIQYSTVEDDRVRPAHALLDGFTSPPSDPIWNTIYPPNDWNCRCFVIPGLEENAGKVTADPKTFKNKDVIPYYFQHNVGNTKVILDPDGYYKYQAGSGKPKQLQAEKNYGMPSVESLYNRFSFEPKIEFADKAEAYNWFNDIAPQGSITEKDPTGLELQIDRDFISHAIEDHKKEHRENYIGNVLDVIKSPDEIWSNKNDKGKLERYYIKYYRNWPLMLITDIENNIKPYSFVEVTTLDKKGKKILNEKQLINKRKNQLIYRK